VLKYVDKKKGSSSTSTCILWLSYVLCCD